MSKTEELRELMKQVAEIVKGSGVSVDELYTMTPEEVLNLIRG